jgi:DNA polymerase-3 subunit gamma/tau
MDAASNRSVDDIRELRERVGYAPAAGRWKVYILDEAHMLTREAWNAFLKTLEEPPPNTAFILATTEPHKVMPTIVDRCQRFDFQRPSLEQIAEVIRRVADAEQIEISDGAVAAIARSAAGSFRDALGTLDQLVSYGGKQVDTDDVLAVLGVADAELILAAADAIAAADGRAALEVSERLARSGRDVSQFARDLLAHLRQLIVIRTVGELPEAFTVTAAEPERLRAQAASISELTLGRAIDNISAALAAIREGDEPRMTVELAMLRAARPQLDPSKEALAERLERLEATLGGSGGVAASAASAGVGDPPPSAPAAPQRSPGGDPRRSREAPVEGSPDPAASREAPVTGPPDSASAPEKAPEAGDAPVPVAGELDLEKLIGLWPAVVEQVRQGEGASQMLSQMLAPARPVAVDLEEGMLEVGFPPSAAFNKRKAEALEHRDRFADAVEKTVGIRLRPSYVLLDDEPEAQPTEPELSEQELVDLVRAEFDAEEYIAEPEGEAEAKEA